MKQLFLTYEEWWGTVGLKRSRSGALDDINMLEFDNIMVEENEYFVDIKMKKEYMDNYFTNKYLIENDLVFLDTIHLVHWANWLNIGVIVKKHPHLAKAFFFSTRVEMVMDEPTFINQPMPFRMTTLADRSKKDKHEFTFMTRVGDWAYIIDDYVIVENQFPILAHYYDKHADKAF